MTEIVIKSSVLPFELVHYILTFDKRFIVRKGKLILISPLVLTNYKMVLARPRIQPLVCHCMFSCVFLVFFTNLLFIMLFTKLLQNGEIEYRLIFEKVDSNNNIQHRDVYFLV